MNPRRDRLGDARRRFDMALKRCRTLTAARVLLYLHKLERRHDRITPSRAQIAAGVGRCERSVTRAIAELETAGAVRVWRDRPFKRRNGSYTRGRTNLYRLTWPAKSQVVPTGHAGHALAPSVAVVPVGSADSAPATLFDVAAPAIEVPSAPPWIAEGISRQSWLARFAT